MAGPVSFTFALTTGLVQRAGNFGICAFIVVAAATTACAESPVVAIEGGPDATGHNYAWTVTNTHASPIVQIEFPRYEASLLFAPDGWTVSCTNLVAIGSKDSSGHCTAKTDSPVGGIAAGRSATFNMPIGDGAKRGLGQIVVRFSDGVTQTIAGVSIPIAEGRGDRNIPLIGLGMLFIVFIVARAARRHRGRAVESG